MSLAKRKHFQKPNCVTVLAFLQTTEEPAKFLEELEPLTLQKKTPPPPGAEAEATSGLGSHGVFGVTRVSLQEMRLPGQHFGSA